MGGLNENGPHGLIYSNVWSPGSGTCLGKIRRCSFVGEGVALLKGCGFVGGVVDLLEDLCHWVWAVFAMVMVSSQQ